MFIFLGSIKAFPYFLCLPLSLFPSVKKPQSKKKNWKSYRYRKHTPPPIIEETPTYKYSCSFYSDFYTEESDARDFESLYKRWKEWG